MNLGSNKSLDLCLFVNGVPVATVEEERPDRADGHAGRRAVPQRPRPEEHVAASGAGGALRRVDTEQAAMTTRLSGKATRFLPFNRGFMSWGRAIRPTPTATAPRTCGNGCGNATPGWTC